MRPLWENPKNTNLAGSFVEIRVNKQKYVGVNITDKPTSFISVIISFDEAFKCGDNAKF
jgi:hypothetical protein